MPALIAVFWAAIQWVLKEAVLKFVLMAVVYLILSLLLPVMLSYITPFITGSDLTSSFQGLSAGMWWFLDFAQLDYGLPKLLSAAITVFIVRRIPFIK